MKKLLLVLVLIIPLFCFSQTTETKVTTSDGKTYSGEIEMFINKKLYFTDDIPELGDDHIRIENVEVIEGYIKPSRKRAILRQNPNVKFVDNYLVEQQEQMAASPYKYKGPNYQISSDIRTASALRLTGAVVGFGSLALSFGGAFDDMDHDTHKTVMTFSMASAAVCYIIGEVTLISATKKMNKDAVTLTGADSGVGLAINF